MTTLATAGGFLVLGAVAGVLGTLLWLAEARRPLEGYRTRHDAPRDPGPDVVPFAPPPPGGPPGRRSRKHRNRRLWVCVFDVRPTVKRGGDA